MLGRGVQKSYARPDPYFLRVVCRYYILIKKVVKLTILIFPSNILFWLHDSFVQLFSGILVLKKYSYYRNSCCLFNDSCKETLNVTGGLFEKVS